MSSNRRKIKRELKKLGKDLGYAEKYWQTGFVDEVVVKEEVLEQSPRTNITSKYVEVPVDDNSGGVIEIKQPEPSKEFVDGDSLIQSVKSTTKKTASRKKKSVKKSKSAKNGDES